MKLLSRSAGPAVIFLISFAFVSCITVAGGIENVVSKSFDVKPGGKLTLKTDRGSVETQGSGTDSVVVEVILNARTSSESRAEKIFNDFELEFDQRGNDVNIRGDYKRSGLGNLFGDHLNVRYIINVPREYDVDIQTSGGSVSVESLEGEVEGRTSGGSLKFDLIKGNIRGNTSGGSIHIGDADGNIFVHTSGGSIRITRATGEVDADTSGGSITVDEVMGAIRAHTSGGSVRAAISEQPKSDCKLSTSGGSVTISLAEDIALNLDAKASGGSVSTEFPVTIEGKISRSSLKAQINGGGPELYLRTSGGGIHIKRM